MSKHWSRPALEAVGPNRRFTGIYRTAEITRKGTTLGGIPLQTATDAVVATVQLGYKIADKQIDRAGRIARRLQGAAERAGVDAPAAVDSTERLIMRALLLGLSWVEGAAGSPGHPMRRILAAEYRMLGSLFGLVPEGSPAASAPAEKRSKGPGAAAAEPAPAETAPRLVIRHKQDSAKRMVKVIFCDLPVINGPENFPKLIFYTTPATTDQILLADLSLGNQSDELVVETSLQQPSGRWRAAICGPDGVQLGSIEIEL